jgi:hypothetical protein
VNDLGALRFRHIVRVRCCICVMGCSCINSASQLGKSSWRGIFRENSGPSLAPRLESLLSNSWLLRPAPTALATTSRRTNTAVVALCCAPDDAMLDFMETVQNAFYQASHWNVDNSYGALNATARGTYLPQPSNPLRAPADLQPQHCSTSRPREG